MHFLNLNYRGQDRTTDVLSFAMQEGMGAALHPELLGDVIISVEQARRQAKKGQLLDELFRLIVHGFCHLRGFDHHKTSEAVKMREEEMRLLLACAEESSPLTRL